MKKVITIVICVLLVCCVSATSYAAATYNAEMIIDYESDGLKQWTVMFEETTGSKTFQLAQLIEDINLYCKENKCDVNVITYIPDISNETICLVTFKK